MNKGNVWLQYFTQDVTNLKLKNCERKNNCVQAIN